jgi:hypothetical protein
MGYFVGGLITISTNSQKDQIKRPYSNIISHEIMKKLTISIMSRITIIKLINNVDLNPKEIS